MLLSWYSQGDVDGAGTCLLTQLSRMAPTMAFSSGYSYSCGGTVLFTGQAQAMSNDNRLVHWYTALRARSLDQNTGRTRTNAPAA